MTTNADEQLAQPATDRDHIMGPSDAPVTLVEYGDFECSYCGQAYVEVKTLKERLGDRLRFVFRNFPLPESHPHAIHAAEAAEAAGKQGKYWDMFDLLYTHQSALDDAHLVDYARTLSLDVDAFRRELSDDDELPVIEEDVESGLESGVQGTPTFFINGQMYEGPFDADSLQEAISSVQK